MNEEDIPNFLLGINLFELEDKRYDYALDIINTGVPEEVFIMILRSIVKNYENKYFSDFDSKLVK